MQTLEDRFWSKVSLGNASDCWEWTATILSNGYGQFAVWKRQRVQAHRFSYELLVGPIPPGLVLHHTCLNRKCVNPEHLIPMTSRENTFASDTVAKLNAAKTHCKNGHPFDEQNTYRRGNERICRECNREAVRNYQRRKRVTTNA